MESRDDAGEWQRPEIRESPRERCPSLPCAFLVALAPPRHTHRNRLKKEEKPHADFSGTGLKPGGTAVPRTTRYRYKSLRYQVVARQPPSGTPDFVHG